MNKKLNFIGGVILLLCGFLIGCNNEVETNPTTKSTNNNPLKMLSNLWESNNADFFVTVSSSYGVSVYNPIDFSTDRAATVIEAASTREVEVGKLFVNDINIPFLNLSYAQQTDEDKIKPSFFLGKVNHYELEGTDFPSFELSQYSPKVTNLIFSNLENNKLQRNSDLGIRWESDKELPTSGRAMLIIYAEDENGDVNETLHKEIVDSSSSTTLTKEEISLFRNYRYIRIFYARGYNQLYDIDGKNIVDLRFVNFSYSKIYFSN